MTNETKHVNPTGHGDFEHRDINAGAIVYFLIGLGVVLVLTYFIVNGVYYFLNRHFETQQSPMSPLITNVPTDTRHLPSEYKTDSQSADYEKYLQKNFPQPQLETNERTELNKIRLGEEDTLSTYDYIDKNAGIVRIPIDHAMDLIVQRGLPVRQQGTTATSSDASAPAKGTTK